MATKAIDFSKLDQGAAQDKGTRVQIEHPQAGLLDSWITVRGNESPVIQQLLRKQVNAQIKRAAKGEAQTIEEMISDAVDKLSAATIGWENISWEGAELPCTPDNCRKLYGQKWLRDFLHPKMEDEANFPLG